MRAGTSSIHFELAIGVLSHAMVSGRSGRPPGPVTPRRARQSEIAPALAAVASGIAHTERRDPPSSDLIRHTFDLAPIGLVDLEALDGASARGLLRRAQNFADPLAPKPNLPSATVALIHGCSRPEAA